VWVMQVGGVWCTECVCVVWAMSVCVSARCVQKALSQAHSHTCAIEVAVRMSMSYQEPVSSQACIPSDPHRFPHFFLSGAWVLGSGFKVAPFPEIIWTVIFTACAYILFLFTRARATHKDSPKVLCTLQIAHLLVHPHTGVTHVCLMPCRIRRVGLNHVYIYNICICVYLWCIQEAVVIITFWRHMSIEI
jgi:hypothetical protein